MSAIPLLLCALASLSACSGEKSVRLLLNDPMRLESEIQQLRVTLNNLTAESKIDMDAIMVKINDITAKSKHDIDSLTDKINNITAKSKSDMVIMAAKINDITTKWTASKNEVNSLKANITGLQTKISALQKNQGTCNAFLIREWFGFTWFNVIFSDISSMK